MKTLRQYCFLCGMLLLLACAKEPPPISVGEFMENPRLLEAAMVRCGQNRAEMKYEVECVNARDAINRLEVREKEARKAELEALSERKRQALRRTQQAAAEARRRAIENQQERETAEYLGLSEDQVPPGAVSQSSATPDASLPAPNNAPGMQIEPPEPEAEEEVVFEPADDGADLKAIREELQRRQQDQPQ